MSRPAPAVPLADRRWPRAALSVAGVAVLAAAWQVAAAAVHSSVLPGFLASVRQVGSVLSGSTLTGDILPSLARTGMGFGISAVVGVTLGVLVGHDERLRDWTQSVVDFLRSLPVPLLVPVAIVVFGLGTTMVTAVIVSGALWPVLLNTIDGVSGLDPTTLDSARACGIRGPALYWHVLLPASSPQIFAGLRVALSVSIAVMVVAEILGGGSGIGYFIATAQQSFDITGSYAGIIVLAGLGWLFDTLFLVAERRLLAWHRGIAGGIARG